LTLKQSLGRLAQTVFDDRTDSVRDIHSQFGVLFVPLTSRADCIEGVRRMK
jgi:hypothetical protein